MSGNLPEASLGGAKFRPWLVRALVMLAASSAMLLVGWQGFGREGIVAALAAAGICLPGLIVPAVVNLYLRDPSQVLFSVLLGMVFRMGVPLAWVLWLVGADSPLVEAGAVYMMIAIYLAILAAETLLVVPRMAKLIGPAEGGGDGRR